VTFSVIDTVGPTITNLTVNPASVGSAFSPTFCNVTLTADITDPSGISIANVDWIATNTFVATPVPAGLGSVAMSFVSGTTWQAMWTVTLTGGPFPYYGTVSWSVTAADGVTPTPNTNNVASVTAIDVPPTFGGCP
jgi:hypothetical protein